jgi:hypothetical protein
LTDAAAAIVIRVDETLSVWREIEHVNGKAYLMKSLLLRPKYTHQESRTDVIGKLDHMFGLSIAGMRSDRGRPFGLWPDPAQGLRRLGITLSARAPLADASMDSAITH